VLHGLRGRASKRKVSESERGKAVRILSQQEYRDFGSTLAVECLAKKHGVQIGREALRQIATYSLSITCRESIFRK